MVSCRHEKRLAKALELTRGHKHDKALVACLIYRGPRFVSKGLNGPNNHAEVRALSSANGWDLAGCVAYVARTRKDGSKGMAKPCKECQKKLELHNIYDVYFTTDKGYSYEVLKQ